jgi:hypothetical protein
MPVSGGMNALNTPMNHYDTQSMGYADGGAVDNALRVARLKFANGGVAEALEKTHGDHAIPLHQAIARDGYATDGSVKENQEDNTSVDNTSVVQQEDDSREKFLHRELEGSAPQYNPSYDRAIKAAYQYTPPGAAMDAAGMLGNPSIKENIQTGHYIPAAMQAAAVAMPLGMAGRKAATAGLKAGAQQLYKLGKPDVVGMPGYTAYKTLEDWAPSVVGQQGWNAAKEYGAQAAEAAKQALGMARGGTTPQVPADLQTQTPESTSGSQTTFNKKKMISPEEYRQGNPRKNEYVMADGGKVHPDVHAALQLANREHARHGGIKQVNPNMDYSNSMRTYYDLINSGHSPEAAAGMVGNFMVESPNKQGNKLSFGETERGVKPGTGGAGVAQWTGPRRKDFQNFAKQEGMDWRTPQANTAFFSHEAKTNPWIGKQLEKVEAQPTAGAAAETAAKQYFRPRADALRNTLGARVGYAQNVADIAGKGNPFGGQALAEQSDRANMFAQKEQEAKLMQANLPKADAQVSAAEQTPQAQAAPTTTGVDNSASNKPPMNFAPPQEQAPVAAPNEASTQNFLKSQMSAPEAPPVQAEAPKMEAPEPVVQQEQPDIPDMQAQAADTFEDNSPFTFDFDQAANGGVIKPHYEYADGGEVGKRLQDHALRLASGGKTPAWQRAEGKNKNGGLNAKGRASAKAEGHNLKPPQPEGGARRDSFCSRMKGMKAKLTSKETANDPDSRINKSLRAWNCHADGGEVWDKPRPKSLGKPKHLSDSQKSKAKAAAKAAGRPYPNLVDNMRAAKKDGGEIDDALRTARSRLESGGKPSDINNGALGESAEFAAAPERPTLEEKFPAPNNGTDLMAIAHDPREPSWKRAGAIGAGMASDIGKGVFNQVRKAHDTLTGEYDPSGGKGVGASDEAVRDALDVALMGLGTGTVFNKAPHGSIGSFANAGKRVDELKEAAKGLGSSTTKESYQQLVNELKPPRPYESVPTPATHEEIINAVNANMKEKVGLGRDIAEGHPVGLRLDIPAYTRHGVWVPTIHDKVTSKVLAYDPVAHISGAEFSSPQNKALKIAQGGEKSPFAKIHGSWKPTTPEEAHAMATEYLDHPDWRQVGMDPTRHSYFYDRASQEPITHADEVLQIGPLVLAKKPVYGKREDFHYAEGGEVDYE